ncbi:hypothetical protein BK661_25325 [Pseudomonas frederiksbergensis]|uniref:Uncharacterized protein n=1 Tax=Pseudomonas frederiksbergensis TaxID=104087 RepID=A0A423IPP0_9PSED|nr:hypothetical protein [Pseudomonas frederiksbergensis]RON27435.1 hypothetical protein BK661_25325 [Pseudomonas frederiksbergensis]
MSGAENVHLIGWVLVFLMILLSQTLLLLGAYFKLDQIEGHFNASHLVSINRNTAGDGPFGRMNRLRLIGALTGSFYQHQMLDPYAFMEAEILPERLRKWAETPKRLMRIAVVSAGLLLLWSGFVSLRTTISNPMSDLKLLYTAILIGFFALVSIVSLLRVYICFFKLEELEFHLNDSYFVGRNRRVMGDGLYGRHYRLTHLSTMLLEDDAFLLRSDPHCIDEIKHFPLHLRRWVVIPNLMFAYSIVGLCAYWLCGTYAGLLG